MRLAVQGAWVADNMRRLGSGAFYHLAYATHQVHPDVLGRLRKGTPSYGRVEIYVIRDGNGLPIANGEIVAVHWFPQFIRIHFMIGTVFIDEVGETIRWEDEEYAVLPSPRR